MVNSSPSKQNSTNQAAARREHSSRWEALSQVHKELKQKSRLKESSQRENQARAVNRLENGRNSKSNEPANNGTEIDPKPKQTQSRKKHAKKEEIDPPRSAYRIFLNEQMRDWINEHPDLSNEEIIDMLAESWQKAPAVAKHKYIQQAQREQEMYDRQQQAVHATSQKHQTSAKSANEATLEPHSSAGTVLPPSLTSQQPNSRPKHSTATKPKVHKAEKKPKKHNLKKTSSDKIRRRPKSVPKILLSKGQLRQKEDGTYARPRGNSPQGYDWDASKGFWVNGSVQNPNENIKPAPASQFGLHPSHLEATEENSEEHGRALGVKQSGYSGGSAKQGTGHVSQSMFQQKQSADSRHTASTKQRASSLRVESTTMQQRMDVLQQNARHGSLAEATSSVERQNVDPLQQITKQKTKSAKRQHQPGSSQDASNKGASSLAVPTKQNHSGQASRVVDTAQNSFMIQRANPKQLHDFVLPKVMPRKKSDGTFAKPRGKPREGYDWDSSGGLWVRHKGTFLAENGDSKEATHSIKASRTGKTEKKTPAQKRSAEILRPKTAPLQASDGTFIRPRGANPSGYTWDSKLGAWVLIIGSAKVKKGVSSRIDARKQDAKSPNAVNEQSNNAPTSRDSSSCPPLKEISFERRATFGQLDCVSSDRPDDQGSTSRITQSNETRLSAHSQIGQKRRRLLDGAEERVPEQPKKKRGRPKGSKSKPKTPVGSMLGGDSLCSVGPAIAEGNSNEKESKKASKTSSTGGLRGPSAVTADAAVVRHDAIAGNGPATSANGAGSNPARKRKTGRPKGSKNKPKVGGAMETAPGFKPKKKHVRWEASENKSKVATVVSARAADTSLRDETGSKKNRQDCHPMTAAVFSSDIESVPKEAGAESGKPGAAAQRRQSATNSFNRSKSQTKEMREASGALLSLAAGLINETKSAHDIEHGRSLGPRNPSDGVQDKPEEPHPPERTQKSPTRSGTSRYVACGACRGCQATKSCGTCLPCMQLLDFAGDPMFEPTCVQRICIAPVLGISHRVDRQVCDRQVIAPGRHNHDALAARPTSKTSPNAAIDSAVESLSDHDSLIADDMSDLESGDELTNAALASSRKKRKSNPKNALSGAELARKLQNVDRERVYEEEDPSDYYGIAA